jgi:hypothetical protein
MTAAKDRLEVLRRQLEHAARGIGEATLNAALNPSPDGLEMLAYRLAGAARLANEFRFELMHSKETIPDAI